MPEITQNIEQAVHELLTGKPVAIPTETVYGLAAPFNQEKAIRAVFSMKQRPLNHPLIVHVAQDWDLHQIVTEIPEYAQRLIQHFWPGPLTLVLKSREQAVNSLVTAEQSTVAIRCPAHPVAQTLLQALNTPLVAPSANPFGKISPTTAMHVLQSFPNEDLTILDGGRCAIGIESTIVDASHHEGYQILRHGMIDATTIAQVAQSPCLNTENNTRVPGKLETHYQPQKSLYYFVNPDELYDFCQKRPGDVFVIAQKQPFTENKMHFHLLSMKPEQAAYELYFRLREADRSSARCIAIELPPDTPQWQGVRERILKAGFPYHNL